ncbi:response regulator [Oligoflexia bacterium]|nr:response regulator [Oligoflexia bacterium]
MDARVLLVDDEPNVLQGLKRAFRKEAYEILTASSGEEALSILEGITVQVVVSDQQMPGLSGIELLAILCEKYPETIRIMLTGQADLDTAVQAINQGQIYRFFTKPCNEIDLAFSIREALQQRELINQSKRLVGVMRMQSNYIDSLEQEMPGLTKVNRDDSGAIVINPSQCDLEEVLEEVNQELSKAEKRLGTKD